MLTKEDEEKIRRTAQRVRRASSSMEARMAQKVPSHGSRYFS